MSETRKVHELKTWPVFYEKIIDGTKTFEVRKNDRNFQLGDILFLREYDPDAEGYTGRSCQRKVTYILGDNPFFQINNTAIMGIQPVEQSNPEGKEDYIKDLNRFFDTEVDLKFCTPKYAERVKWYFNTYGVLEQKPIHPSSETSKADHIADSGKRVEPSEQRKAKEVLQILKKYSDVNTIGLTSYKDAVDEIVSLLQEYKAQGSVTDEEIDEAAFNHERSWEENWLEAFAEGAKAHRDGWIKKVQNL